MLEAEFQFYAREAKAYTLNCGAISSIPIVILIIETYFNVLCSASKRDPTSFLTILGYVIFHISILCTDFILSPIPFLL